MNYKTITLELIHGNPRLYESLRTTKRLLSALDSYSAELKQRHEELTEILAWERPDSDLRLLSSQAMELAIQELQSRLPCASEADDEEIFSLEGAMNYVRAHTPTV